MDLARTGTGIGAAFPGQVRRLAGATVVMGAIVVIAFATTGWLGTASKSESPLADGSYAHVEEVRAAYGFGGSVSDGGRSRSAACAGGASAAHAASASATASAASRATARCGSSTSCSR